MEELIRATIFFGSFFVIWFAAGLIVKGVDDISHKLNLSSFSVSFFLLGLLTSIPELSMGINSILLGDPEIFVGNLIGGVVILLFLIIPILAIFGNGIKLKHQLDEKNLIFSLLVVITPVFFIADNLVTRTEAVFLILIYLILVYFIEKRKGFFERVRDNFLAEKSHILLDLMKIVSGIVLVFLAARLVVRETVYFSNLFNVPIFLVSLLVLPLGTNLPEFSIAIRSILSKKKDIAFGDYMGSAAANSFLFGILTLINGQRINVAKYSVITLVLMLFSFFLFYYFSRSKNDISRQEGLILFANYLLFVSIELFI